MVAEQKRAWFVVGVFAVALAGGLVAAPFAGLGALGASGLLGLWGLIPFLFRKKRDPAQVATDERDRMVLQKAALFGGMMSYLWFVLACMTVWFIHMYQDFIRLYQDFGDFANFGQKTISIHVLPVIVMGGAIILMVVTAVAALILYGREAGNAAD